MTDVQLAALLLTATALLAYANSRWLQLPSSVGLMATALVGSLALLALDAAGALDVSARVRALVDQIDFGNTLLHGMLGWMLFAGALHVDMAALGAERRAVAVLAVGGTLAATALVGGGLYVALAWLGHPVGWIEAALFGALIAPTDPIAVLGMLKSAAAPPRLAARIAGESLFNDGVGVVIFTVLLALSAGAGPTWTEALALFAREAIGGCAFGAVTGFVTLRLLRPIDDATVEVLLTLALVVGGYTAAEALGVSAPLGAVVAGLVIGHHGRGAMSERSRAHVDLFWTLIDELLNAVLFLMIGLLIVRIRVSWQDAGAAALTVPIVLAARWLSVGGAMLALPALRREVPHSIAILTWGGLRGGLSIAMALALPPSPSRELWLVLTYTVVASSILIQGLTFGRLVRALGLAAARDD